MNYIIKIEGQEIDMPEEIAGDDASLKSALAPYFPGAANAKFMRSEEKDGVITVTVVKQAGTKGSSDESHMVALAVDDHTQSTLPNFKKVDITGRLRFSRGGIAKAITQILESGGEESTHFKNILDQLHIRLESPSVDSHKLSGYNSSLVVFDELSRCGSIENLKAFLCSTDGEWIRSNLDLFLPGSEEDQVLRKLINAPAGVNPVVELHRSLEGKTLNQMTVDQLMELDDQIDEIIQSGLKEKSAIDTSLALITKIAPIPSKVVPVGF